VFQQVSGKRKHAAFHFHRGHIFSFKLLGSKIVRPPRIYFGAARKNIDRGETVFGPGVDGQMRFSNHHHARNAVWIKRVKHDIHDSRFGDFCRFDHDGFDFVYIVQDFGITLVKFYEEVPSERSQGEKNYRTSASGVNQFRTRIKYIFRRFI
jgi:hypothetical protein